MKSKVEKNILGRVNKLIFGSTALDEVFCDDEEDELCENQYQYNKREPYKAIFKPEQNDEAFDLTDKNSVDKDLHGKEAVFKIGILKLTRLTEVQSLLDMTFSSPVIVELLGEEKQRMLDMISGAAYAGKLSVCRVASSIFLVAPECCSVEDND